MRKFRMKEAISIASILLCPNFQIGMKVESAQNTAFDQVPFCLRKTLEGTCKVHILIWQINVCTLKQTNSNNKQRKAHVLPGRKIFLVFKNCLLRRIFPIF